MSATLTEACLPASEAPQNQPRARLLAGLTGSELGVLGVALLLPVVFAPQLFSPFWAAKMALVLCVTGAGLVILVHDGISRDRASIAALAFLGIAGLSTLLSDDPVASLVGLHEVDDGLLLVAGCIAMWVFGRHLGPRARVLLPDVLLIGIGLTAGVAWLQTLVHLSLDELGLYGGIRAGALQGNPIYTGALTGAALVLVAARAKRAERLERFVLWLPVTALFAGAAQLSGSRIALFAGLGVLGVFVVRDAIRGAGWVRAGALVAAAVIGVVLAMGIAPSGGSATDRTNASEVGTNWQARVGIWGMGLKAFEHDPILGVGPGRFRAETSRYMPLDIAQDHGPDVLLLDGHNVAVEYLTTTGVLGLLAAAVWMVLACRRARGPLALFALVIGITWLLEPQGVDTTPLLLLALGASAPWLAEKHLPSPRPARGWAVGAMVALLVGVLAAGVFLYGERELGQARDLGSQSALDRARPILGFYPVVSSLQTEIDIRDGMNGDRAARARALAAARATVAKEPTRPDWWNRLGEVEGEWGTVGASRHAFHEALNYNPWSVRAMHGLAQLALNAHDHAATRHWEARLCRYSKTTCPAP
jgi:hypothetical protein